MQRSILLCLLPFLLHSLLRGQEVHGDHAPPEKLGTVSFPVSCSSQVQASFNRAVALLHSFAYKSAEAAFEEVSAGDPDCAMAHWGVAMSYFHQLWEPPLAASSLTLGRTALAHALAAKSKSASERAHIEALSVVYADPLLPYSQRVTEYQSRVCKLAEASPGGTESQVFCGLALLASASPFDKSHRNQKLAASMLEPLHARLPDHPGIVHYLIHAYDNTELAQLGLPAARQYASLAPAAPHALHMPSHIFTRLGMWQDSISSNLAARRAAQQVQDLGEELHAMDYLVYAYLQVDEKQSAADIVSQMRTMSNLASPDFKISYAATAMQSRYAIALEDWHTAMHLADPVGAPPHVTAISAWTRAFGYAQTGHTREATLEVQKLQALEHQLRTSAMPYWADQVAILQQEVVAWCAEQDGKHAEAVNLLTRAADAEDLMEKLPVTPGPIVPAREQLGYLLLRQREQTQAAAAFRTTLLLAPGRLGALQGLKLASQLK